MTRTSPPQVAFSAGEIDPLLHARFDYARFQTGLARCHGFLPLPQGGFTRAPGTTHLGFPANAFGCILIPFQFAANDAVMLEFTDRTMRVWRYGELVRTPDLASVYQLATPYTVADLPNLRWVQSADVIYLADGRQPIHRLARFALNSWAIAPQAFDTGPFRLQNIDTGRTLSPSGLVGTITLTANTDTFAPGHVGSLFQLKTANNTTISLWQAGATISIGDLRRYDKNIYRFVAGVGAGLEPPIHEEGIQLYSEGRAWEFVSDDTGVVRITDVASFRVATAQVIKRLPDALLADPTYRWSEGAWNNIFGYPNSLEIYDQRLVAAGTVSEPRTVWFSTVGSYGDFSPSVEPDGAFAYTIAGNTSQNRITALRAARSGLYIFALSETYSSRSESQAQVIGPTTAVFGLDGSTGAKPGTILAPDGDPIFITRDGKKLFLVRYDLQSDANRELNLSRASQHLGNAGFEKVVWQRTPEPRAWIVRKTGDLAVLIYDQNEEILGWSTHSVAGRVLDIAVTVSADGSEDEVWLVVERTVDLPQVFIERLDFRHHFFSATLQDLTLQDPAPEPIDSLQLPWLAGRAIGVKSLGEILRDYEDEVSPEGELILDSDTLWVVAGLIDGTHHALTLDVQAAAPDGNTLGRAKRLSGPIGFSLHDTEGGTVQVIETHEPGRNVPTASPVSLLPVAVGHDLTPAYTGPVEVMLTSGQAKRIQLRIAPKGGARLTVLGITPTIKEAGR